MKLQKVVSGTSKCSWSTHFITKICDGRGLVQVDISHEAEVQQMVLRACEEFGRLDILINNAARFVFNFVTEITDAGWLL